MAKRRSQNALPPSNRARRLQFECPVCAHAVDCEYKLKRDGEWGWVYNCPRCSASMNPREYNLALREHDVYPSKILSGDFSELRPLGPTVGACGDPEPLPGIGYVGGCASALETQVGANAWRYLTRERGLLPDTIRRYELGWDRDREELVVPVFDLAGALVNAQRRKLGAGAPFRGLRGRGSQLYPITSVRGKGPLAVCEGEFDALVLNQAGLRAVTSTAGAGHWNPKWTPLLQGQRVAVIYDVDAERRAEQRADEFHEAGVDAWAVHLSRAGFRDKADVSDVLIGARRPVELLRQLIRSEREAA